MVADSCSAFTRTGSASVPACTEQKQLTSYELLIVDELGYVPLSKTGAELLFETFSQRYERASTLVTSNLPFEEWTEVFGSERLTGALLDRITHHVHILEMNGDSYRLKQSRRKSCKKLAPGTAKLIANLESLSSDAGADGSAETEVLSGWSPWLQRPWNDGVSASWSVRSSTRLFSPRWKNSKSRAKSRPPTCRGYSEPTKQKSRPSPWAVAEACKVSVSTE
jgi:hypothetical protein